MTLTKIVNGIGSVNEMPTLRSKRACYRATLNVEMTDSCRSRKRSGGKTSMKSLSGQAVSSNVCFCRKGERMNRLVAILMTLYVEKGQRERESREKRFNLKKDVLFRRCPLTWGEVDSSGNTPQPTHQGSVVNVDRKIGRLKWVELIKDL